MKSLIRNVLQVTAALMVVVGPMMGSSMASAHQDSTSSTGPIAAPCCTKACGGCL